MLEIVDFHEKSRILNAKNCKDTTATRQNRIKIWIMSIKIYENREKVEKTHQNHRQNPAAPSATLQKLIKTQKTLKNRKDTTATLQKLDDFRKILYQTPGKMLEIVDFHEKS